MYPIRMVIADHRSVTWGVVVKNNVGRYVKAMDESSIHGVLRQVDYRLDRLV